MELHTAWPLFDLRIETTRLVLRPPTDEDFPALLRAVRAGIHDPQTMPFAHPWTDIASPQLERQAVQYWWRNRALWTPESWDLTLAVFADGEAIGVQGLHAPDFGKVRTIETGSWLTQRWQGKGVGKEMRRAAVQFAFEYLLVDQVTSAAFSDNTASNRVSLASGYEPNGIRLTARRGEVAETQVYRLTRARWTESRPLETIRVHGFEQCRSMFGI
jgi:RimJ/RimL family protein N-acetyltransferase